MNGRVEATHQPLVAKPMKRIFSPVSRAEFCNFRLACRPTLKLYGDWRNARRYALPAIFGYRRQARFASFRLRNVFSV